MYPILFKLGHISIYSFSFLASVGFIVAIIYSRNEVKNKGMDPNHVSTLAIYELIFSLFLGSRILFIIIIEPEIVVTQPLELFMFWKSKRSSLTLIMTAIPIAVLYTKKNNIPFWRFTDALMPGIFLAGVITKIGCLLAGCCYGKPTSVFWAITLHNAKRHPVQIYDSLAYLFIFIIVNFFLKKKVSFYGQTFLLSFGILYPIARIITEFFRDDSILILNIMAMTQLFAISGIILSSFYFYRLKLKNKRTYFIIDKI